jgi:deazaflavin-dependent oxidoreductase (nitroreductase family)
MKLLFKIITRIHVFLYRLSGGRFGSEMRGFQVLLLITVGRKSGKHRTTPLGFFQDNDNYVIIGSNGGLDYHPAWYYNLKSNPTASIQFKNKQMMALAEVAEAEDRRRLWLELMTVAPGYADYQKRTSREIPLVVLKPQS